MTIVQNVVNHLGEGDYISFDKTLYQQKNFLRDNIKHSLTYPSPRSLLTYKDGQMKYTYLEDVPCIHYTSCCTNVKDKSVAC